MEGLFRGIAVNLGVEYLTNILVIYCRLIVLAHMVIVLIVLIVLCFNVYTNDTEVVQRQTPVAVDHIKQRTIASETGDPIDWTLSPTLYTAASPERYLRMEMRAINQE